MPDDLRRKALPNGRGQFSEPFEVQSWADKFGVSKERLSETVRKSGTSAEAVSRVLKVSHESM